MDGMGFDAFSVGVEPEYFLFRDRRSTEPLDEGGYFDLTTLDAGSDVRRETVLGLEQLGIPVSTSHHEGGPSQHEIALRAERRAEDGRRRRDLPDHVKEYAIARAGTRRSCPSRSRARTGRACTRTSA
jgi:glutamine synthetase